MCDSPCRLTSSPNIATVDSESSPSTHRSLHPSNLTIAIENGSDESAQPSPVSKRSSKTSEVSITTTTGGSSGHLYENIDNFENAIPINELVLCHRGCQSDFDPPHCPEENDAHDSSQISGVKEDISLSSSPKVKSNHIATTLPTHKPRPPQRTVSLSSEQGEEKEVSSGKSSKFKDASTQHGGVLKVCIH